MSRLGGNGRRNRLETVGVPALERGHDDTSGPDRLRAVGKRRCLVTREARLKILDLASQIAPVGLLSLDGGWKLRRK